MSEQKPVAVIYSVRVGGGIEGSLRKGANAAEVIGKPLYTHPAPAVVKQLVEAAGSALEAMQSVAGEAYQRAEPVCCGRGGNECCGCPEPKWNSVDEVTMIRLHRPQQELTAALAAAKEAGL